MKVLAAFVSALLGVAWAFPALAYRPFDGTDADVATPGEFELEAGPLGLERQGGEKLLVGPALVLNYGVVSGAEVVLEGRQQWSLPRLEQAALGDVALSLKSLLREGSLQGGTGVSVALENGVLLPGSDRRLGAHLASIFSWRWPALTLHWNLGNDLLASVDYFASTSFILEGPVRWRVRPVAELWLERDFRARRIEGGLARSVLLGAILPCGDAWSFDVAVRHAVVGSLSVDELRLGFTWSFVARPARSSAGMPGLFERPHPSR